MEVKKHYKVLEHTADVRIRVTGKTLRNLFVNAATALSEILYGPRREKTVLSQSRSHSITLSAATKEDLFVAWLNEILSLSLVKKTVFSHFIISALGQSVLKASLRGYSFSGAAIQTEVKAVTYHGLSIERKRAGWEAEVIFDV